MEWFSTLSLALGSAWTSGINLYATVTVFGLLQKFGVTNLPGGLDALDNWWIIGVAAFLYMVEFFADKIPYVDSVWDVVHTFIRVPAGAVVAYAATNQTDHERDDYRDIARRRLRADLHTARKRRFAPERIFRPSRFPTGFFQLSKTLSLCRHASGGFRARFDCDCFAVFAIFFVWFAPKVFRALRRIFSAIRALFAGESFHEAARKAG